jgi:polyisoprenoid-binding protein YceI
MAWLIDHTHSLVEFSVTHLMISTVKGRFSQLNGTIHLDPKTPENCWVKAEISAASIHTNVPQRDAHLRSADFFNVSKYPTITFESTRVQLVDQTRCILYGQLTLLGVTREVAFQVAYTGRNQDPLTGAWRVGLIGRTMIDRRAFGMTFNQVNAGSFLIGYNVGIELHIEAVWT